MPNVNETLLDEFLRHAVYVERFKAGQLQSLRAFLDELMADVSSILGQRLSDVKTSGTVNTKRLQALLLDLEKISNDVSEKLRETVTQQMKDLAIYEHGWTLATLQATIPVIVDFTTVAPAQLWAAVNARPFEGREFQQWFKDYSIAQANRITQQVRIGVIEGETIDQTMRRIRGTQAAGYKDGIIHGINRRGAEALVRTTVNHVVTMARQATFDSNTEVVAAVTWRSTLDGRTSEICQARDGKVFPVDSGPRPPAHPNCRSTIVPVVKTWKQLGIDLAEAPEGTRASLNGQVPASETYQTWLSRQPVAFQNDVLGKTKGILFRKGELQLDKFVDMGTGRAYTLEELRRKHPDVFKKAGL